MNLKLVYEENFKNFMYAEKGEPNFRTCCILNPLIKKSMPYQHHSDSFTIFLGEISQLEIPKFDFHTFL